MHATTDHTSVATCKAQPCTAVTSVLDYIIKRDTTPKDSSGSHERIGEDSIDHKYSLSHYKAFSRPVLPAVSNKETASPASGTADLWGCRARQGTAQSAARQSTRCSCSRCSFPLTGTTAPQQGSLQGDAHNSGCWSPRQAHPAARQRPLARWAGRQDQRQAGSTAAGEPPPAGTSSE